MQSAAIVLLVLYAVGFVVYGGCLVTYLRSPWRFSPVGRSMMGLYASLTAVLGLAVVLRVLPLPYWALVAVASAALGAVDVAGLVQWRLIRRVQREGRP